VFILFKSTSINFWFNKWRSCQRWRSRYMSVPFTLIFFFFIYYL